MVLAKLYDLVALSNRQIIQHDKTTTMLNNDFLTLDTEILNPLITSLAFCLNSFKA